ncbi:MAG: uncharacterized protein KVP18_003296 [Porospora cf. gigantea A]|uniref:uncharacterized protein n=1 Tax=Porospora cf. gigantea A TaxID=2853593 RepID=UPI003559A256|nr:MAG: hypothetical protein KVP18_003296 [Porospora cf. gigantea A]
MDQFAARVVLASSVGDWDVLHARVMSEPLADWESAGLKAITATATDLPRVCRSLVETACETLWPSPHSALSELHSNKPVVYLGLKSQNGCRVALKQGALTEISGETGVGKTQFCMTLATRALKDDSTLKVLWFESEGKLSAGRFREIGGWFGDAYQPLVADCLQRRFTVCTSSR